MSKFYKYNEKETDYLSNKDKKMKEIILLLPHIDRELDECDLFQSLMHHIIGQQISTSAQKTIYARLIDKLKVITPESVYYIDNDELQGIGITYKKSYLHERY